MTQATSSLPTETDAEPSIATVGDKAGPPLPAGSIADDQVEVCRQMILLAGISMRMDRG